LGAFLQGRSRAGMLCNAPEVQPANTTVAPAAHALKERELWLPFLRRFRGGEDRFVHWCFWPTTVFSADATRELVRLSEDPELCDLLARSSIWATEEVVLPTLVALLGFELVKNPCADEFVQYRKRYGLGDAEKALDRRDVFWVHPVPRRYDDPVRRRIRKHFGHYAGNASEHRIMATDNDESIPGLVRTLPILQRMRQVEGWLNDDEADLLVAAAQLAMKQCAPGSAVVEVGSHCGRSTVVLGSVVQALGSQASVVAIDTHDGMTGARDLGLHRGPPTRERFRRNIQRFGLTGTVRSVEKPSAEVAWSGPIALLLIDKLHDYESVSEDFHQFEGSLAAQGLVVFHDYAHYFPGVMAFVDELLAKGSYRKVAQAGSLVVLGKSAAADSSVVKPLAVVDEADTRCAVAKDVAAPPLVSCIMPTADRPEFVTHAIEYFLRQDYPHRELIVVDDGARAVADRMPSDARVRYVRLEHKRSMGWKHNLACDMAEGEIVAHWDDDDWYADWRLSYQVRALYENPHVELTGLSRLLFLAPDRSEGWVYQYPSAQRPWVCGNTFCYRKGLWNRHRFADLSNGADTRFVWAVEPRSVLALPRWDFLVAIIHAGNTSPKRTSDPRYTSVALSDIRRILGDDWRRYPLYRPELAPASKASRLRAPAGAEPP
ncbi:MAG: class I SAM-dependent methyltransferase, partial [Polyangiaceae bacterium]|nr:class I SAM-dependent methyltransferase [Polyangiaceae bacterium]